MDKRNRKILSSVVVLKRVLTVFFEFFLNIYLFELVNGDFGFLMGYSSYGAVVGLLAIYLTMRILNNRNVKVVFGLSLVLKIICIFMLLFFQKNLISVIWVFKALDRISDTMYACVYETTLIKNAKRGGVGSFVAGMSILESVTAMVTPVFFGYVIDVFSYETLFIIMAVDAIVTALIGMGIEIGFKNEKFKLIEFWRKAFKKPHMREAYKVMFYQRITLTGALKYLVPVLLFMTLKTEFSVGSYKSLFAVIFIIMMEGIRLLNKRKIRKNFYVLGGLLLFMSALVMMANLNESTVLLYYFMVQTVGDVIMIEARSTTYATGKEEGLVRYTRENIFTWNVFLVCGQLIGNLLAFLVCRWFYGEEGLAIAIVILMSFIVVQAYHIQNVQKWLRGR